MAIIGSMENRINEKFMLESKKSGSIILKIHCPLLSANSTSMHYFVNYLINKVLYKINMLIPHSKSGDEHILIL